MIRPLAIVFVLIFSSLCCGFRYNHFRAFRGRQGPFCAEAPDNAFDADKIDYDAPLERRVAVGKRNIKHLKPVQLQH